MHQLMLVTVSVAGSGILKPDDSNSEGVRRAVYRALEADRSFVDHYCDWFVIGGRWTGWLAGLRNAASIKQMYEHYGAEADAMVLTPELYEAHLAPFAGQTALFGSDAPNFDDLAFELVGPDFLDLDEEPVDPDFVGRKWLLVVDYHCC
jgi:hypothetical protein